jgi:polyhydroxybutyrate depolymerase
MKKFIALLGFVTVLGCGTDDSNVAGGGGTGGMDRTDGMGGSGGQVFSPDPSLIIGGDRPALVGIPLDYDPTVSHPLIIVLHGFGPFTGEIQAGFLGMLDMIDEKGFVMVLPDGTLNENGNRFWNGATACCDPNDEIDDVGYLSGLIEEAKQIYNVDEKRVYLMGHSNGGFMSFRMACEASELITAIVSLAGSTFADSADCQPATLPVSVLAVHGTADGTILYDGVPDAYPSAPDTVESFASAAGCDTSASSVLGNVDLIDAVDGDETEQVAYTTGCQAGLDAGLWTIQDGPHIPFFNAPASGNTSFAVLASDWLLAHSR